MNETFPVELTSGAPVGAAAPRPAPPGTEPPVLGHELPSSAVSMWPAGPELRLAIVSDGSVAGTRIVDAVTGRDLTEVLGARRVAAVIEPGTRPRIEIDMLAQADIVSGLVASFYLGDPYDGCRKRVARVEFSDGSVAVFPESAAISPEYPG